MTDKNKGAKDDADKKGVPAAALRDLDMLDSKIEKVKGGAMRTRRNKRLDP